MVDISVLVIQADETQRARTVSVLAKCCDPDRIAAVGSASEAIDYLLAQGAHAARAGARVPRFLLVDLPADAGMRLLDAVRIEPHIGGLPVIALLDCSSRAEQEEWYRAGANSVVRKTPDDEELRHKLRRMHDYWTTVNVAQRSSRL